MSQNNGLIKAACVGAVAAIVSLAGIAPAAANVEQVKIYKKVFPESKAQCITCHVDKLPKKDDGKHELNAYGLKVKQTKVEMDAAPNEETYKKVGSAEEFEATQKTQ